MNEGRIQLRTGFKMTQGCHSERSEAYSSTFPSPGSGKSWNMRIAASSPGGRFINSVDLFLNLEPFSRRTFNEWGRNQDVRWIVETSRMKLVSGDRSQLFGYPGFSTEAILGNLENI